MRAEPTGAAGTTGAADATRAFFGAPDGWDAGSAGVTLGGELVVPAAELPLRGEHNALNLCAALTALPVCGIATPPLPDALRDFHALPHRLRDGSRARRRSCGSTTASRRPRSRRWPRSRAFPTARSFCSAADRTAARTTPSSPGPWPSAARLSSAALPQARVWWLPRARRASPRVARDRDSRHGGGRRACACAGRPGDSGPALARRAELRHTTVTSRSAPRISGRLRCVSGVSLVVVSAPRSVLDLPVDKGISR